MGNPNLRKGKPNPYGPTGLSRRVLLQLEDGPATISSILGEMVPRSDGVNRGTILTILNRAILNGLVTTNRLDGAKKPYLFELTDGGRRRIEWIHGTKAKVKAPPRSKLRIVANPNVEEDE
jgi:hypothetical protein